MRLLAKILPTLMAGIFIFIGAITPADAACKKMGFLVNDYGKDGPTKDAQMLLDKHIAAWADEQGIEEYSVGKKSVKCELFLDFIVFDEHTCTATATVCWGGSKQPKTQTAKKKKKSKSKQAKAKKTPAKKVTETAQKETASENSTAKKAVVKTVSKKTETIKPAADAVKSGNTNVETSAIVRDLSEEVKEKAPAVSETPKVPYTKDAIVRDSDDNSAPEGGQDTKVSKAPAAAPVSSPQPAAGVLAERAAADRAAAAAERAAAAAERAAAAAQQAAEAAKQAAAAHSSAVVAPVEPTGTQ